MNDLHQSLRPAAEAAIDAVLQEASFARAAVVSTEDGFLLASRTAPGRADRGVPGDASRLAAMAGSLAALGTVAAEESALGACLDLVVEAEGGYLLVLQAKRAEATLILSVMAGRDALLGQLLFVAKQAVRGLAAAR